MVSFADRVQETTTTSGTGTVTLAGATTGYQSFQTAFTTGTVVNYCITDGANWEVGLGNLVTATTLSRTTVLASSNSGSLISLSGSSAQVFATLSATQLSNLSKLTWANISSNTTATTNFGYVVTGSTQVVLTLPTSGPSVGDKIEVDSTGSGGTKVGVPSGATLYDGVASYASVGSTSVSVPQGVAVTLLYEATNAWRIIDNHGTYSISSGAAVDPFWNDVSLLLRASSTTVSDASNSGLTLSLTSISIGNIGPSPAQDGYWFGFNGTSSYVTVASPGAAAKFSGDFTLEGRIYCSSFSGTPYVFDTRSSSGSSTGFALYLNTSGNLVFYTNGAAAITSSSTVSASTNTTWALTRTGSVATLFLNGVPVGTATVTANFSDGNIYIGRNATTAAGYFPGAMEALRLTNGACRRAASYTPAATPYFTATDTACDPVWNKCVFASGFENNLTTNVDLSGNNLQFTATGATQSSAYAKTGTSSLACGNSNTSYINDTGFASANLTGDWTMEMWIYVPFGVVGQSASAYLFNLGAPSHTIGMRYGTSNVWYIDQVSSQEIVTSTSIASASGATTWHHVAAVKCGNTVTLYCDGVSLGSNSAVGATGSGGISIGSVNGGGSTGATGTVYIDQAAIHGFAKYTANFTPPANLFTALPTTYDPYWQDVTFMPRAAASSVSDASGNALAITATSLTYGNSTPTNQQDSYWAAFGGSSSLAPTSPAQAGVFGTGDFTVEAWLYPTSLSGTPGAWSTASSGGSSTCHALAVTSSNIIVVLSNTNVVTYGTPLATNTWSHVAVVRQGTTVYLFVNGFLVGTGTSSGNLSDTGLQFGAAVLSGWAGFTGKMAGMRVTKAARYTANFTPPTTPFLTTGAL